MGVILRYIFVLQIVLFSAVGWAQETPEVHKINGKKYYLHIVEKGNTLYGISRLYNLDAEVITEANKEALVDGLKENQTLLIPVTGENKKKLTAVTQTDNHLIHSVQPKETLFSISKKYNVPLESLMVINQEVISSGLKAGSQIKIPIEAAEVTQTTTQPALKDSLETHTIVAGDTPFSIAKKYGITLEALSAVNQNRPVLTIGDKLRIPGTSKPSSPKDITSENDTIDTFSVKMPDSSSIFHVALLLPIQAVFPDTAQGSSFRINNVNRIALEYLRGFEYALDSLKNRYRANLKVHVFSMLNDSASIKRLKRSAVFDSINIVIGPFYSSQFEYISDMFRERGVLAICPVNKPSKILFNRPNAIKTIPSESMQIHGLANILAEQYMDSNLVLVNSNKFQDTQNLNFFKQELSEAIGQADTITEDPIAEIKLWDINSSTLSTRFTDSGNYILIVPSIDQVFVTRLLGSLYDFMLDSKGKYTFQVFGLEEWQKWQESLNVKQLQSLQLTLPITDNIDMQDYRVHGFYKTYYKKHGYEPTTYTLHGYDHCEYLFRSLSNNPEGWFSNPESTSFRGLLNNFNFVRVLEGSGIENYTTQFYQIKDYRLTKVGQWPLEKTK